MSRFIVAGLGPSIQGFSPPAGHVTIGVNDIQRHFVPDHLMIMDDRRAFKPDRQEVMDDPQFNHTLWWRYGSPLWHSWRTLSRYIHLERYRIRRYKSPDDIAKALRDPNALMALPHSYSTVYAACSLAVVLGATWVGVIGLDLVGHHLAKRAELVNRSFACLKLAMDQIGVTFVNLSDQSLITSIPHEQV